MSRPLPVEDVSPPRIIERDRADILEDEALAFGKRWKKTMADKKQLHEDLVARYPVVYAAEKPTDSLTTEFKLKVCVNPLGIVRVIGQDDDWEADSFYHSKRAAQECVDRHPGWRVRAVASENLKTKNIIEAIDELVD